MSKSSGIPDRKKRARRSYGLPLEANTPDSPKDPAISPVLVLNETELHEVIEKIVSGFSTALEREISTLIEGDFTQGMFSDFARDLVFGRIRIPELENTVNPSDLVPLASQNDFNVAYFAALKFDEFIAASFCAQQDGDDIAETKATNLSSLTPRGFAPLLDVFNDPRILTHISNATGIPETLIVESLAAVQSISQIERSLALSKEFTGWKKRKEAANKPPQIKKDPTSVELTASDDAANKPKVQAPSRGELLLTLRELDLATAAVAAESAYSVDFISEKILQHESPLTETALSVEAANRACLLPFNLWYVPAKMFSIHETLRKAIAAHQGRTADDFEARNVVLVLNARFTDLYVESLMAKSVINYLAFNPPSSDKTLQQLTETLEELVRNIQMAHLETLTLIDEPHSFSNARQINTNRLWERIGKHPLLQNREPGPDALQLDPKNRIHELRLASMLYHLPVAVTERIITNRFAPIPWRASRENLELNFGEIRVIDSDGSVEPYAHSLRSKFGLARQMPGVKFEDVQFEEGSLAQFKSLIEPLVDAYTEQLGKPFAQALREHFGLIQTGTSTAQDPRSI